MYLLSTWIDSNRLNRSTSSAVASVKTFRLDRKALALANTDVSNDNIAADQRPMIRLLLIASTQNRQCACAMYPICKIKNTYFNFSPSISDWLCHFYWALNQTWSGPDRPCRRYGHSKFSGSKEQPIETDLWRIEWWCDRWCHTILTDHEVMTLNIFGAHYFDNGWR